MRTMNSERSFLWATASSATGDVKLGQPVPESNLVSEWNSAVPQQRQL